MQDRQWRLATAQADWRNGEIEHDINIVSKVRRSVDELALPATLAMEQRCNDDVKSGYRVSGKACLEFIG